MQQNKLKKYLTDIIETIDAIFSITKDLKYADMEKIGTRWALERGISIIGEAIYQANKMEENLPITDIKKIATTRHIIVHDYGVVDKEQIFIIVKKHLPLLKKEVEQILKTI